MKLFELGKIDESHYDGIGGKARGLDLLQKAGYPVPAGFLITEIDALTEEDFSKIEEAFVSLGAEEVSVRSSASNEDGNAYSNAGQYETCLNVGRQGLREAIERCLASLHGERAETYNRNFLDGEGAKMNLVVQTMVDAAKAGVLFSTDPLQKQNLLIEAVDGLGEGLVSGEVASCRYSIPRERFSPIAGQNLTADIQKRLYEDGLRMAEEFFCEVDIEWALDKNGRLFYLQMRPITTLDAVDLDEFNPKVSLDNHLITSRNIGEMMPGAVTPLSISTSVLAIDYGVRNMLAMLGVMKRPEDMPDFAIAFPYKNHLFFDMNMVNTLALYVSIATPEATGLSIMGEYPDNAPPIEGKRAPGFTRFINSLKMLKYLFSSKKARKTIVALNDTLSFTVNEGIAEIYREIDEKLPAMNEALGCHYVCSSYSGSMNSTLFGMLEKQFPEKHERQAFISRILSDIEGIESADILAKLSELAGLIKQEVPNALTLTEEELYPICTSGEFPAVKAAYDGFIERHGHRSIKEAELRSRAWRNDHAALMKNLYTVLHSEIAAEEKQPFSFEELLKDFSGNKKTIEILGGMARSAVVAREFSKSYIIKIIDKFKDRYASLAALLVKEGLLPDEDCIYFLTHREIGELIGGKHSLTERAAERRRLFPEAESLSFPDICIGPPQPIDFNAPDALQSIRGIPVSHGKVYGRAHVVTSPKEAEEIQKGEIMVAPYTDIGWSPYYSVIGALVTEVGSTLSHGAVVAREYHLPTIVNAGGATKIIHNGDYLYINADIGEIDILSEEEYRERISALSVAV